MKVTVRDLQEEDLAMFVGLCAEHAAFERSSYDPAGKVELMRECFLGAEPRAFCLIAEDPEGRPLGYATLAREFSTWDGSYYVHIDCLYVVPDSRGRGAGIQLIRELARRSLALGTGGLAVQWQTPAFNDRAIRLYEVLGAQKKEKVRFYLDEPGVRRLAQGGPVSSS